MEKQDEIELILTRLSEASPQIQTTSLQCLQNLITTSPIVFNHPSLKQTLTDILPSLDTQNQKYLSDLLSFLYVVEENDRSLHYRLNGGVVPIYTCNHQYVVKLLHSILEISPRTSVEDIPVNELREIAKHYNIIMSSSTSSSTSNTSSSSVSLPPPSSLPPSSSLPLNNLSNNLLILAVECISFLFSHNSECEGIDFLLELNLLFLVTEYINSHNFQRIRLYLSEMSYYIPIGHELISIYTEHKCYVDLLLLHLKSNDISHCIHVFNMDMPYKTRLQCAFILGRLGLGDRLLGCVNNTPLITAALSNTLLSKTLNFVFEDLEITPPKHITEFIKGTNLLKQDKDLALKSFVSVCISNGLVHMGYTRDLLFFPGEEDSHEHQIEAGLLKSDRTELISLLGSMGLIYSFTGKGIEIFNDAIFNGGPFRKMGGILGMAIAQGKLYDESHTLMAIVNDLESTESFIEKLVILLSINIVYCNTNNEMAAEFIVDFISCTDSSEVIGYGIFVLGSVKCGVGDTSIFVIMRELLSKIDVSNGFYSYALLGMGLLFLGCGGEILADQFGLSISEIQNQAVISNCGDIEEEIKSEESENKYFGSKSENKSGNRSGNKSENKSGNKFENKSGNNKDNNKPNNKDNKDTKHKDNNDENILHSSDNFIEGENSFSFLPRPVQVIIKGCVFVGTGNTTLIESILSECISCMDDKILIACSFISIALISMGDDLCVKMVFRLLTSSCLLESGYVKQMVNICLALLFPSTCDLDVIDFIGKQIHSPDEDIMLSAIGSLGVIGSGSNNSKISNLYESLYSYHGKNLKVIFLVKVVQGLLHLGKGIYGLKCWGYDKRVLFKRGIIGVLSYLWLFIGDGSLGVKYPFMLYNIVTGVSPKYVVTVDEEGNYLKGGVKVGNDVNVVGVAGHPRRICGVQVHNLPVILGEGERAEVEDCGDVVYVEDVVVV
ncbi:regulatory subunit of 26S proteasome [Hamiltosporidium tvaerminnensis]|uniref:Regulatory subunit of 26S proteasome n=1 Tax=Hamiltosporidium tvaerminnensis TaxID=1176355 RepID=A0A4Q9LX19_9MICR|nr:regulatory subunit of 26S proteasome [Hamiltosporidium tvaerminnensis]